MVGDMERTRRVGPVPHPRVPPFETVPPVPPVPPTRGGPVARAWPVWVAAVCVYVVAVFNRSSLGVAGLLAERRFGVGASALSTFTMAQMLVYAGMQIPVGLLVDRFGPRRLLVSGLSVMCLAQACFAGVGSFGPALAARALLGCGDAMIFISVLRIVAAWFPGRRVPLLTQLTSLAGAAGSVASAWPLTWALRTFGWSATFAGVAAFGACVLVLPLTLVRDAPAGPDAGRRAGPAGGRVPVRTQMRESWARPETRLGLWVHFTTGFPAAVFTMLWGFPFLVQGEGLSPGSAGALLTLLVGAGMVCGFGFGHLIGRHAAARVPLALAVAAATALCLTGVLAWPGRAPFWLLTVLVLGLSANGAGSMIGFDLARTANPPHRLGTACGMVNVGSFVASAVTLPAIGLLLDAAGVTNAPPGPAVSGGYKAAFCFFYLPLALGTAQILRLNRIVARGRARGAAPVRADAAQALTVTLP